MLARVHFSAPDWDIPLAEKQGNAPFAKIAKYHAHDLYYTRRLYHKFRPMLVPEVGPAVMPSIATHLNANVSIIGNTFIRIKRTKLKRGNKTTEKEDAQYCLRVGPNPVYTTKMRKPRGIKAPAFIEDPTYRDIKEVMKGE